MTPPPDAPGSQTLSTETTPAGTTGSKSSNA